MSFRHLPEVFFEVAIASRTLNSLRLGVRFGQVLSIWKFQDALTQTEEFEVSLFAVEHAPQLL